ncbi:MAG TPA: Gfo/Idh/MocA family oxidoreductase [Plantibacter sp.]|uniref:Gfo/Idh/MocA family protein n=1 Tax=Plantibacter sp. TaxID=1871045 RepID=UPI002C727C66|nr:Gfo/Idh/MocA family oxidoreductase [Plantibacter sp.]
MAAGLHVGVIGVGRIGAFHVRTLRTLADVSAVTVADADPAQAVRVASEVGGEAVATPEALVEAGIDALVIATSTAGHAPLLRLAAQAALPTFCEKPVALDLATMDELVAEAERAAILVQIGFQRRFDAGYAAARKAVADGTVGNLLVVRAATHDPAPPPEAYIAGSGGIFRDLHIHDFDAVRFVTGQEIVEVYADGVVRETPWFERQGDVDTAVATFRLGGGALGILSGARHDALGYDVRLEVFGTSDSIVVGVDSRSPIRSVEPGTPPTVETGYRNFLERFEPAYRAELAAFVDAVRNGRESVCTLQDARAALRVALAADRSRTERRPVTIDEVTSAEPLKG